MGSDKRKQTVMHQGLCVCALFKVLKYCWWSSQFPLPLEMSIRNSSKVRICPLSMGSDDEVSSVGIILWKVASSMQRLCGLLTPGQMACHHLEIAACVICFLFYCSFDCFLLIALCRLCNSKLWMDWLLFYGLPCTIICKCSLNIDTMKH